MTQTNATEAQIEQLRKHAVNDVTREIMRDGVLLSHDQADELGEEVLGWMGGRLGLSVKATDRGVECSPNRIQLTGLSLVAAQEVADAFGCDLSRGAFGKLALTALPVAQGQGGNPVADCREKLEELGYDLTGVVYGA